MARGQRKRRQTARVRLRLKALSDVQSHLCMSGIPYIMQRNNRKSKQARNGGSAVRAPAAMNRSSRQTGRQVSRYRECERVATIAGATNYAVVSNIACNPGLAGSFPWLSGHANLYERYRVHKLVYRYKNLKGTDSDGNIIMSFDYDTLDGPPVSAIEQCQSTRWIDGAPWRIFELHVPTDSRILFTRAGAVQLADLKTYDIGRLFIAAEGCADTSDHGILEVEYDIELIEKQPSRLTPGGAANRSVTMYNLSTTTAGSPTIDFDEVITNGLSITNVNGSYTLPAGAYILQVDLYLELAGTPVLEFRKDGVSLNPLQEFNYYGATGYIESDGTNVLTVSLKSGSCTLSANFCRLKIQAL